MTTNAALTIVENLSSTMTQGASGDTTSDTIKRSSTSDGAITGTRKKKALVPATDLRRALAAIDNRMKDVLNAGNKPSSTSKPTETVEEEALGRMALSTSPKEEVGKESPAEAEAENEVGSTKTDKNDNDGLENTKETAASSAAMINKKGMELDDLARDRLNEARQSLNHNVLRLVEPVKDEAYAALLEKGGGETYRDDVESTSSEEEDEMSFSSSSSEEEDEKSEIDDEELLDDRALSRARELRAEVRELSFSVSSKRDRVVGCAVALATGEMEELLRRRGIQEKEVRERFDERSYEARVRQGEEGTEVGDAVDDDARLEEMRFSLRGLAKSLDGIDADLPDKIEDLKETVETIEAALDRQQRLKADGDDRSLPATERAILSKTNEGQREKLATGSGDNGSKIGIEGPSNSMKPEQRFALFMSGA